MNTQVGVDVQMLFVGLILMQSPQLAGEVSVNEILANLLVAYVTAALLPLMQQYNPSRRVFRLKSRDARQLKPAARHTGGDGCGGEEAREAQGGQGSGQGAN